MKLNGTTHSHSQSHRHKESSISSLHTKEDASATFNQPVCISSDNLICYIHDPMISVGLAETKQTPS